MQRKIQRAVLSVTDKSGLLEFAQELEKFGVEILSTGGTAGMMREGGVTVQDVSDFTGLNVPAPTCNVISSIPIPFFSKFFNTSFVK